MLMKNRSPFSSAWWCESSIHETPSRHGGFYDLQSLGLNRAPKLREPRFPHLGRPK